ncbi:Oxidoreductase andH [Hypsizygus marmoreus]|uniref:Oxidoreductase andH n=1 Tax=Hypsizygus marmoreus TaxID=39966 RepID=A0A369K3R0_HYPMA|nr:Oxidoreductase andH [Hypsizygus marmoreus]
MVAFAQAQSRNTAFSPSYVPTAIFVGGTSGIGQAMAEALVRTTKGNCNIILIGRNRTAAESIIASFPEPTLTDAGKHEFVECDVSRMKNVHATTARLVPRLSTLNYLVLSPGMIRFTGRRETEEGIDEKLALIYYARWAFINDLLPLLKKAKDAGQDAKVLTVLAAGAPINVEADVNDLGMVKNYSGILAMRVAPTYNDLMLEKFAAENPSISFVHTFPGSVLTTIFFPDKFPYKLFNPLIYALLWPFSVSQDTCAEYMWYALHEAGPGFHRCSDKGDDVGMKNYNGTEEAREALWVHTRDITNVKAD